MLTIATDTLPQSCLSYIAFRVSFQETVERIALANQMGTYGQECFGFLTEVPFLRATAPHVQLDLLAETWHRHMASEPIEATLTDEAIVYAVCETASRLAENEPETLGRIMQNGPLDTELAIDETLATELRGLHLNLSNDGDFLMISQFEDMSPEEAIPLKVKFGLTEPAFEEMFEILGRWLVSADFLTNLNGLLTGSEIVKAVTILAHRD